MVGDVASLDLGHCRPPAKKVVGSCLLEIELRILPLVSKNMGKFSMQREMILMFIDEFPVPIFPGAHLDRLIAGLG